MGDGIVARTKALLSNVWIKNVVKADTEEDEASIHICHFLFLPVAQTAKVPVIHSK